MVIVVVHCQRIWGMKEYIGDTQEGAALVCGLLVSLFSHEFTN